MEGENRTEGERREKLIDGKNGRNEKTKNRKVGSSKGGRRKNRKGSRNCFKGEVREKRRDS